MERSRKISLLKNVAIGLFCVSMVEGCFFRDPYSELLHGYGMGAISASSPCRLGYSPSNDDRVEPSEFLPRISGITKVASDDRNVIGVYEDGFFLLTYETNHVQTFENEADWKQAVAKETKLASAWMHNPKAIYMQTRPWWIYLIYLLMMCWAIKDGFQEHHSTTEVLPPLR